MVYRLVPDCLLALLLLLPPAATSNADVSVRGATFRRQVQDVTLPWYDTVPSIDWSEDRSTFALFPPAAASDLTQELHKIHSPLSLNVTVRVSNMNETFAIWTLLKGLVHRFRRQNQIIHVNPHYYVATGVETNCRQLQLDSDTGILSEAPILPPPDHCTRDCTNQGRYCLRPFSTDSNATGVEMIQETLRRICFEQLYKASDLRFMEYHEALQACHATRNYDSNSSWESCGLEALSHVDGVSAAAMDDCIHRAGGTQENVPNVHLQLQIDQRKKQTFYEYADLPMINVAGKDFRVPPKDWTVNSILSFVCQVYRDLKGVSPLGCQVCEPCKDARKCLWTLECDGQPFSMSILDGSIETNVNNETPISHVNSTNMTSLTPLDSTMIPMPPTNILDFLTDNDTYTVSSGVMSPHNTSSADADEEDYEDVSQREVMTSSALILILMVVVCVFCLQSNRIREEELKRQYKASTEARWRSRELDDVPSLTGRTGDDPRRKSVRFDVGDLTENSTSRSSSSSDSGSRTSSTWYSFWHVWLAGDPNQRARPRLHDNVNKFSRKRRQNKRTSINAGRRYDPDGARVKMEQTMRSLEAVFGMSLGESARWNTSAVNDSSRRFSLSSHASALAEAASSGQTPPRMPLDVETLSSLAEEEVQDENPPDHLRYSSDWTVGFGQNQNSPDIFADRHDFLGMAGNSDINRNPVKRAESNVSAESGCDSITDVSISSVASRTRYSGSVNQSSSDLFAEDETVFNGLEDVTMF